MGNLLAKRQMCVLCMDGAQIWIDEEDAMPLQRDLEKGNLKGIVGIVGRSVSVNQITGVYYPEDIDNIVRRKNGQWQCKDGAWHDKGEKCGCLSMQERQVIEARYQAIKDCTRGCTNGFIFEPVSNSMVRCKCLANIGL